MGWRRGWDSNPPGPFRINNLRDVRCQGCQQYHQCRGALHAIARQGGRRLGRFVLIAGGRGRDAPSMRTAQRRLPSVSLLCDAEFLEELETLIRGLAMRLQRIGVVPWVVTFDNMPQVTGAGRRNQPLWTLAFRKVPPISAFIRNSARRMPPQQKGAVEFSSASSNTTSCAERSLLDGAESERATGRLAGSRRRGDQSSARRAFNRRLAHRSGRLQLVERRRQRRWDPACAQGHIGIVIHLATNSYNIPVAHIGQTVVVLATAGLVRVFQKQLHGRFLTGRSALDHEIPGNRVARQCLVI